MVLSTYWPLFIAQSSRNRFIKKRNCIVHCFVFRILYQYLKMNLFTNYITIKKFAISRCWQLFNSYHSKIWRTLDCIIQLRTPKEKGNIKLFVTEFWNQPRGWSISDFKAISKKFYPCKPCTLLIRKCFLPPRIDQCPVGA